MSEVGEKRREGIPRTLENAIQAQVTGVAPTLKSEKAPLSPTAFDVIRTSILRDIERESGQNQYHNHHHTFAVEDRFVFLSQFANLTENEIQQGRFIGLFHDYGHPGKTIRQTVSKDIPRKDLSNEEYASVVADEKLSSFGLRDDEITFVQNGILGTTFGQMQGEYARPYKPLGKVGKLIALADVGGFLHQTYDERIQESLNVLREGSVVPENFTGFIAGEIGFLKYIRMRVNDVEEYIGSEKAGEFIQVLDGIEQWLTSGGAAQYENDFLAVKADKLRVSGGN